MQIASCFFLLTAAVAGCGSSQTVAAVSGSTEAQIAPTVGGTGWPNFRGPNANGLSTEKINANWAAKAPKVLWQHPMTDRGYSGPSVAGGAVYIIDHQESGDIVRAWRQTDGKELWTYSIPDSSPENMGFTRSTPTVSGGHVFVLSRFGQTACLDAKSGKKVWQKDIVGEFGGQVPQWAYSASPLIDGDKVILVAGANDAALVGLDIKTGERVYKGGAGMGSYATPVIATIGGTRQYVTFLAKKVCGIDTASGKELWSYPWETSYDVNAAAPLVIGQAVFISSGYGKGCAMVDVKAGKATLRWQNRAMQAHFSSPIFDGKMIYGTGDPGQLMCLDPATGATLWKQGGFEKGGIIGVDGMILGMNGSNGDLILAKMQSTGYQELGRVAPIHGQAWTAPIVADKIAIIRTSDAIAALDLS